MNCSQSAKLKAAQPIPNHQIPTNESLGDNPKAQATGYEIQNNLSASHKILACRLAGEGDKRLTPGRPAQIVGRIDAEETNPPPSANLHLLVCGRGRLTAANLAAWRALPAPFPQYKLRIRPLLRRKKLRFRENESQVKNPTDKGISLTAKPPAADFA